MLKRVSNLITGTIIVVCGLVAGSFAASAQEGTPAGADTDQLFVADGIDATILAQSDTDGLDISGSTLVLELIELAPDTELAPHDTTSPELFSVLSGVLVFRDNFGFASLAEAGSTVSLNPGTQYTIANEESEPGRILRLRLAGSEASTPAATPVAGGGEATVLAQVPLQDLQMDSARMYLARVQFGAGADSGEQEHPGPIGLYVASGALNVVSPSGLVGTIGEGQAVSLPVETPLSASTGETEAVAYIAGVSGPENVPFERVASVDGATAEGSVLESGETWSTGTAEMAVEITPYQNVVRFGFTYTNTGDSAASVQFDSSLISVTDDRGGEWRNLFSDCKRSQELAPGDAYSCRVQLNPPTGTPRGPLVLTIHVGAFGDVQDASWQAEIDW